MRDPGIGPGGCTVRLRWVPNTDRHAPRVNWRGGRGWNRRGIIAEAGKGFAHKGPGA